MADKSYWQDRQEKKYLSGEKKINTYYKGLEKSFEQARKEVQKVINDFVIRYSIENDTPGGYATAQRLLNKTEIGDLQAFIDLAKANIGKYNQELNNMSIRARVTRYQALEKQIDAILQKLYGIEYEYKGEELLKEVYSDSYYQTWFNIDQYKGFHEEFAQVNPKTVEELIKYPWNGADFSNRLWKQKEHMLQQLNESITTMLIQGKNPMTLSKDFAKKFNTKEFEAYRLIYTEGSFMIEQGSLEAYKEDGVEKYQILATLDIKTSEICRDEDGEIYNIVDAVTGKNYPPYHPFCRTTTVPYYDDSETEEDDTRIARDEAGKNYKVSADMTYKKWYEKYFKTDISQNNILIHKSLGAAARNYDVKLPNGTITKLVEGTKITKVYTFAGKGTNRKIDVAKYLEMQYNVPASEWLKSRGDGYVIDENGKIRHAELHWFESKGTGRIKMKVKRYFDES